MITRNPRAASSAAWPKRIQLVKAFEKKPWIRTSGRPSPISVHAISVPSKLAKRCVSVGNSANRVDPLFFDAGIVFGPLGRKPARVKPCLVHAFESGMFDRAE